MLNKDGLKAYLALGCVCFFWGTTYLAIRVGVQTIPPLWLVGIRQTIAGLLICGFFLLRGAPRPTVRDLRTLLIAGVLMIIVGNGFVSWAEVYVPSGLTALLCSLVPFWIILMNLLTGQTEGLKGKAIVGLLIGLAGLVLIFFDNLKDLANPDYLKGVLAILFANAGWAGGTLFIKRNPSKLPPLFAAGLQILLAGMVVDFFALAVEKPLRWDFSAQSWWALLYLIVLGSILAYGAYVYALSKLPATVVSLYAYINPVVAVLLGWLLLDEKLNLAVVLAMGLILFGVYIVNESFKAAAREKALVASAVKTVATEPTDRPEVREPNTAKIYDNG